jgi:hypothetical protein
MKTKLILILSALASGCATPRTYHIWAGGRASNIGSNSSSGYGGQIGFTEQIENLVTTIGVFYTKYKTRSLPTESLDTSGKGVDAIIGYNIGIFRPGIGYDYEWKTYQSTNIGGIFPGTSSMTSSNVFKIGPGIAIDLPISPAFHAVIQTDYRFALTNSSNTALVQAGIRIGGFSTK